MAPTLRTGRLLLEPYVPDDEDGFVTLFQDTGVSRWMGEGPSTEAEDRALFGRIFSKVAREAFDVWAVRRGETLVGHAELKPSDTVDGHEIVYALTPAVWGRGLGTELVQALVAYGFRTVGLTEVYATVAAQNKPSLALLDGIGFEHVRDVREADGGTTRVLVRRPITTGGPIDGHEPQPVGALAGAEPREVEKPGVSRGPELARRASELRGRPGPPELTHSSRADRP